MKHCPGREDVCPENCIYEQGIVIDSCYDCKDKAIWTTLQDNLFPGGQPKNPPPAPDKIKTSPRTYTERIPTTAWDCIDCGLKFSGYVDHQFFENEGPSGPFDKGPLCAHCMARRITRSGHTGAIVHNERGLPGHSVTPEVKDGINP